MTLLTAPSPSPAGTAPGPAPVNLRDAGALAGAAARLVRRGVLLRSDAPVPGDRVPDLPAWPPSAVLDLREPEERGDAAHPWEGPGTRVVGLPMVGALPAATRDRLRRGDVDLPELYAGLVDRAERWLPDLVHHAARADGPVLLHCAAGKDRTGVTIAVLLTLAGVPRAAVVDEYRRTHEVLPALATRLRTAHPHRPVVPEHLLAVSTPAIEEVLQRLLPDPAGWCVSRGAASDDIARWQRRIWPDHPWW